MANKSYSNVSNLLGYFLLFFPHFISFRVCVLHSFVRFVCHRRRNINCIQSNLWIRFDCGAFCVIQQHAAALCIEQNLFETNLFCIFGQLVNAYHLHVHWHRRHLVFGLFTPHTCNQSNHSIHQSVHVDVDINVFSDYSTSDAVCDDYNEQKWSTRTRQRI